MGWEFGHFLAATPAPRKGRKGRGVGDVLILFRQYADASLKLLVRVRPTRIVAPATRWEDSQRLASRSASGRGVRSGLVAGEQPLVAAPDVDAREPGIEQLLHALDQDVDLRPASHDGRVPEAPDRHVARLA